MLNQIKTASLTDQLTALYLTSNQLITLDPIDWDLLLKLEILDLSFNKLRKLPRSLSKLDRLKSLNVGGNQLESVDLAIPSNVQILKLFKNKIGSCDFLIQCSLKKLRELDLSNNNLTGFRISADFGLLKTLNLDSNKIDDCDLDLKLATSLSSLTLSNNQLRDVPASILSIQQLQVLDLSRNQIKKVSSNVEHLVHITELSLAWNQVSELPSAIGKLWSLQILDIRGNPMTRLPATLGKLKSLKEIVFDPDQQLNFKFPPLAAVKVPSVTVWILDYLQSALAKNADPENSIVFGSGLSPNCIATEMENFSIRAFDKFGTQKREGGDSFSVIVHLMQENGNTECRSVSIQDLENGTYDVLYDAKKAGMYKIYISLDDLPLKGSPFIVQVDPSPISGPSCFLSDIVVRNVNEDSRALIHICDTFGNKVYNPPSSITVRFKNKISATDDTDSTFKLHVDDSSNGLIPFKFSTLIAGSYEMHVEVDGDLTSDSPVSVNIRHGPLSIVNSIILLASHLVEAELDSFFSFRVELRDAFYNLLQEKWPIKLKIMNEQNVLTKVHQSFTWNHGQPSILLKFAHVGQYAVHVQTDAGEDLGSPFRVIVSATDDSRIQTLIIENHRLNLELQQLMASHQKRDSEVHDDHAAFLPLTRLNVDNFKPIIAEILEQYGFERTPILPIPAQFIFKIISSQDNLGKTDLTVAILQTFLAEIENICLV